MESAKPVIELANAQTDATMEDEVDSHASNRATRHGPVMEVVANVNSMDVPAIKEVQSTASPGRDQVTPEDGMSLDHDLEMEPFGESVGEDEVAMSIENQDAHMMDSDTVNTPHVEAPIDSIMRTAAKQIQSIIHI